jgi:ABC-type multidrug transport system permease subunit
MTKSRPAFVDRAIVQLVLVRFREFVREPEAVFWAILFPVLITTGLGLAFRSRPDPVLKIAATPALAATLRAEPGLDVTPLEPAAAREALRVGQVVLFAEQPDPPGAVVFYYDDTNAEGRSARALADHAVQIAAGRVDPVKVTEELTRAPGARYVDFLVPGLIGLGIMSNGVWGLGFSIVDSRRRKLIKRLLATPMSREQYLLSYVIWRGILLPVEVVVPLVFGALAFGVPVRGSWLAIAVLSVLGSLCFSAVGVLVGSRARTIEALSGLVNLTIMPMWILSGVFFSAQRFPDWLQPIIHALPLTAFIDALRAIQLQGAGLGTVWPEMGILAAWLAAAFIAARQLFKWQ